MNYLRAFARSGNQSTLAASFVYFDTSFMIWVLLGTLANFIVDSYHLSATQKGLMTALPVLSGSVLPLLWLVQRRWRAAWAPPHRVPRVGIRRAAVSSRTMPVGAAE